MFVFFFFSCVNIALRIFVLTLCDEHLIAGQNVFLGSTNHVSHLECFFESHQLRLIHETC